MAATALPALYLPHGGGPMPLLDDPAHRPLTKFLSNYHKTLPSKPKAILMVTAHWEESVATITKGSSQKLLFDYYGFPPETYKYTYPAPGADDLSQQVANLLKGAGIASKFEEKRGFDHGVFVPLMLMFPKADIPVVAMSLVKGLDPEVHWKIGEALKPLRKEGVLVLGSGFSFHNMQAFMGGTPKDVAEKRSLEFDQYLTQACTSPDIAKRRQMLKDWANAPSGRFSHPREEHLLPLMVIAGSSDQPATKPWGEQIMSVFASAFQFE